MLNISAPLAARPLFVPSFYHVCLKFLTQKKIPRLAPFAGGYDICTQISPLLNKFYYFFTISKYNASHIHSFYLKKINSYFLKLFCSSIYQTLTWASPWRPLANLGLKCINKISGPEDPWKPWWLQTWSNLWLDKMEESSTSLIVVLTSQIYKCKS